MRRRQQVLDQQVLEVLQHARAVACRLTRTRRQQLPYVLCYDNATRYQLTHRRQVVLNN